MTKVNIINNTAKEPDVTHSCGNFYLSVYGTIYILSVVEYNKVCLINTNGTRWNDAYEIKSISNITEKEFSGITHGNKFTKIDSVTITIN